MRQKLLLFLLIVFIVSAAPYNWLVFATVTACSASVSSHVLRTNASGTLVFSVSNGSSGAINWVKISAPSGEFEITSGSAGGWSNSIESPTDIVFTGGSLAASASQDFSVSVQTSSNQTGAANWTVSTSDSGGSDPFNCSGDTSVAISNDTTAPTISNISAGNITSSGATITWTTNETANSSVEYGTSISYGANTGSGSFVTNHSVDLSGLGSSTVYHYRVKSTDNAGNQRISGDNTFTTAVGSSTPAPTATPAPSSSPSASSSSTDPSSTPSSSTDSTSDTEQSSDTIEPILEHDTTAPVIKVATDLTKVYATPPLIMGTVADNGVVRRVEYSTDNGKNWLPASLLKRTGQSQFAFTPGITEEGNYPLIVRAVDESGNTGQSPTQVLIIDRNPPSIRGMMSYLGPQVFEQAADGSFVTVAGLDLKITLESSGGATGIDLFAGDSTFSLVKNIDQALWSGALSFTKPGRYALSSRAIDGAGRVTEKDLGMVTVLKTGAVYDTNHETVQDAVVSVWVKDQLSQHFVLWDGDSYLQSNPQKTDQSGAYRFLLPAGTYYIEVLASNFQGYQSSIFTLNQTTPIQGDFTLSSKENIWQSVSGFLGDVFTPPTNLRLYSPVQGESPLIKQDIPDFQLTTELGESISPLELRGKQSIFSLINTWSPQSDAQLAVLQDLAKETQLNVFAIVAYDSSTSAKLLKNRGGYSFPVIADPEGVLADLLKITRIPTTVGIDSKGVIELIKSGVVTKEKLLEDVK